MFLKEVSFAHHDCIFMIENAPVEYIVR